MTKGAKMQKKPQSHKRAARKPARRRAQAGSRWSGRVTASSDALDLEEGVFKQRNPAAIAQSLRRSAIASRRRKSDPYRSAMSMLVFYINRAGSNLSPALRRRLEAAKGKLRKLFGRRARG